MSDVLEIFTIYDHPKDLPKYYVVRRFTVGRGNPNPVPDAKPYMLFLTIGAVHLHFQMKGLIFLQRDPSDDPLIIGSYM